MRLSKSTTVSLEGDRTLLLNRWPYWMRAKTDYTQPALGCQALRSSTEWRISVRDNDLIYPPFTNLDSVAALWGRLIDTRRPRSVDLHPTLLDEPASLGGRHPPAGLLDHRGQKFPQRPGTGLWRKNSSGRVSSRKSVGCLSAEEGRAGYFRVSSALRAVHESRHLTGKGALRLAAFRRRPGALRQLLHTIQRQEREVSQEADHVTVRGVEPKLIHLVGRGAVRVQPDRPDFGLPELATVVLGDQ